MNERINQLLNSGEQLRWTGRPVPGKFMAEENRSAIIRWFVISGSIFLALLIAYLVVSIQNGTGIFNVFSLALLLIGGVIVLDPYTTYRKLRKTIYAVTTQRIIVSTGDTNHFALPLEKADTVTLLPGEDGLFTVCIGSPTEKIKPQKIRAAGITGYRYDKDNVSINYPVFYNIEDAEKVKGLIEACRQGISVQHI